MNLQEMVPVPGAALSTLGLRHNVSEGLSWGPHDVLLLRAEVPESVDDSLGKKKSFGATGWLIQWT